LTPSLERSIEWCCWQRGPIGHQKKIKGRKLFIVARDDANDEGPQLPKIRANFEKLSGPKELLILDGSAHAQFLFATDQRDRLLREILHFLAQP